MGLAATLKPDLGISPWGRWQQDNLGNLQQLQLPLSSSTKCQALRRRTTVLVPESSWKKWREVGTGLLIHSYCLRTFQNMDPAIARQTGDYHKVANWLGYGYRSALAGKPARIFGHIAGKPWSTK